MGLSGSSDFGCMLDDSCEFFIAFHCEEVVAGSNVECED